MKKPSALVIGGGVGGLSAALRLCADGWSVTVLEKADAPGGKLRTVSFADGPGIDAGPTVFTMKWVFDLLFQSFDMRIEDHLDLISADILARHAWQDGSRLDLFADIDKSADVIGDFAGAAEATGYRAFCAESADMFRLLREPFLCKPAANLSNLIGAFKLSPFQAMRKMQPFNTMWRGLTGHFRDPRLRQLFGRYATYCGSSPYLAPATLMLVAHVEQDGVWYINGGMFALVKTLAHMVETQGGSIRCGAHVDKIEVSGGRAQGVTLNTGERLDADVVIMNGDVSALSSGLFGPTVRRAAQGAAPDERSLSAMTWMMEAKISGFPLVRHNVFFSDNYEQEFKDIFHHRRMPSEPTVYVCAQDRDDDDKPRQTERLFMIVNAPADGDRGTLDADAFDACDAATFNVLRDCGLEITQTADRTLRATPNDFHDMFPATGGALYGRASHGWQASLKRPGSRSKVKGLYLAGGSAHPGPGVPMAALSGLLAADCILEDVKS